MTALAGYAGIHGDEGPPRRLRELAGEADSRVSGAGWMIASVGCGGSLPGDDGPIEIRDGADRRGLLFGRIFDYEGRRSRGPVPLDWIGRHGRLPRELWGRYVVGAVRPDGALSLARDPIGLLPCFHATYGRGQVFATRMTLLLELLGKRPAFDWDRLGRFITGGPCPTVRTGFEGVRQLPPGVAANVSEGVTALEPLWDPVGLAAGSSGTAAPSPDEVRHTLRSCTEAWISGARHVTLDLSGGLDSSSVCWAMSRGGRVEARFVEFPVGASIDERPDAQRTADRLGVPLRLVDAEDALPLTPPGTPHPRTDAPQLQSTEARLNKRLADMAGPDAEALSGGGGDQVFLMKSTPAYLADHILARGVTRGLLGAWRESGNGLESLPALLAAAGAEIVRKARHRPVLPVAGFDFGRPPWLRLGKDPSPVLAPPADIEELSAAKAHQVLGISYWGDAADRQHRNPHRPSIYPLLSQPVIELALRTPVHLLVNHGGDRLVLRRAMRDVLPREVTDGRLKGSYAGMYQHALRRSAGFARDLITRGRCAERGLVDPATAMDDLRATGLGFTRGPNWPLFNLLAVEMWCRAWEGET